ncbi:MAG TPA: PilZ domain-containing protein [Pseudolabrys sp.]|nr:PilZ domain-containing protein [Pseudolabrys sp.]
MVEKRKAARSRTLLGGVIAFNDRASTMDCQVRNLSTGGAKVTFDSTAVVPDRFDLKVARKERSFRARMIWRTPNEAGVAFLNEYNQDVPVPLEWAKRLRDCEAEKAALRKRIAQLSESNGI